MGGVCVKFGIVNYTVFLTRLHDRIMIGNEPLINHSREVQTKAAGKVSRFYKI